MNAFGCLASEVRREGRSRGYGHGQDVFKGKGEVYAST